MTSFTIYNYLSTLCFLIIFAFNFYIATAKDLDFKSRFWEMTAISFGVAIFSFGLGYVLKMVLGVDA